MPIMGRAMKNSQDINPDIAGDHNKQDYTSFFAMTMLGAGEVVGGLGMGLVKDKFGTKVTCWA